MNPITMKLGAGLLILVTLGFLVMDNRALRAERDKAEQARDAYAATLEAYKDQFADQVATLNAERQAEIARGENLIRQLNLIGDMNESENLPVPDSFLRLIGSLYGPAGAAARPAP